MDLIALVKATYVAIGQDITDIGLRLIVQDLQPYPEAEVRKALERCRRELRRISLADILDRMPRVSHPGVETAWSIVGPMLRDESRTVLWTTVMAEAAGAAFALADDPIAARMAFKESYEQRVGEARAASQQPVWVVSLGTDRHRHNEVIEDSVKRGLLSRDYAEKLLRRDIEDEQATAVLEQIHVRRLPSL